MPVLQLNYWAPRDELGAACCGAIIVVFLAALLAAKTGIWIALAAAVALLLAMWKLWVPVRYEMDARGVQRIVLGRRSFRPWSDFIDFSLDPVGVCLIENAAASVPWSTGVRIVAKRDHLRLVELVSTYIRRSFTVAGDSSKWNATKVSPS